MAYQKIDGGAGWDEATDLHADFFDHMEDGIVAAVRREGDTMTGNLDLGSGGGQGQASTRLRFGAAGRGIYTVSGQLRFATADTLRFLIADAGIEAHVPVTIEGASAAKIATGTYSGNGTSNRLISTPFDPKFVYMIRETGSTGSGFVYFSHPPSGSRAFRLRGTSTGQEVLLSTLNSARPGLDTGGFRVGGSGLDETNASGETFTWVAFG